MNVDLIEQKNSLRAAMRLRLAALTEAERAERSQAIVRRIIEMPAWQAAGRVLLFAPLGNEPDLDLLWREGALQGKLGGYPRVGGSAMRLFYVETLSELEPTRWGLREPPAFDASEALLKDFDLVLVPGVAFDAAGGRLGRGGGFYDRLLVGRKKTTRLIGIGFSFQLIDGTMPLAAHDVPLDEVCTD